MSIRTEGIFRAQGLRKRFGRKEAVKGVDLYVSPGEIVGLLGPNGAGKTTTFYILAGFLRPETGDVFLDQEPIGHLPVYKRARKGIIYLPQEPSVFRRLTVEDNVRLVLEELKLKTEEISERLERLLTLLGLEGLRRQKAYSLSGGERRRVEIMRALAMEPRFLLLDEPFAGIDPLAVSDLKRLLAQLKSRGLGILISDHNVRDTLAVCDRAYIMAEGRVVAAGPPEEVVTHSEVRRLYLGEDFTL
ncbi:LPS export ABC transporter ATP-binding protein [Thermosulfurimonas sp.]|uniref:LPS export ABC transporter ATP-binding protein n=1 Tax=Thermosulfurimonas sp. TaxID=2080236 RepID=UPI0025F3A618|nr:LPS export ABC transporter ATP-binding protein [Thermosulfurimonas sp.]